MYCRFNSNSNFNFMSLQFNFRSALLCDRTIINLMILAHHTSVPIHRHIILKHYHIFLDTTPHEYDKILNYSWVYRKVNLQLSIRQFTYEYIYFLISSSAHKRTLRMWPHFPFDKHHFAFILLWFDTNLHPNGFGCSYIRVADKIMLIKRPY